MKKVLVTGGAGFVGSHLCRALHNNNHEVFSLDNYFTGSKINHYSGINYINGDVKDIFSLIKFSPDIIYHLGEYSRVEQSFNDRKIVWDYNSTNFFKILEFSLKNNSKIIYAGSSTKFGDDGKNKNASPYAWSKSRNTDLIMRYNEWYNLNYAIVYFYNVYGPNEISEGKYATVIAKFKNAMCKNKVLTIVKPGTQKRNFTHIEDIIDGLILVGDNGYGDGYGIGSSEEYSIEEVAKMFGGEKKYLPERKGNRMSASVITEKVKALGWNEKKCLKDYINKLKNNNWKN